MTAEQNKLLIQRLVEEAVIQGNLDVLAEVAEGEFAQAVRQSVGPFRERARRTESDRNATARRRSPR